MDNLLKKGENYVFDLSIVDVDDCVWHTSSRNY